MKNRLFRKLQRKGYVPTHVAEVGVYLPQTSNIHDFIMAGIRSTLVEPDPASISVIKKYFAGRPNVTLHALAVYDRPGSLELVRRGASTYAAEIEQSPAVVNDAYELRAEDCFTVKAVTFDEIDDGTIDVLSIDIEGGEWFVLKHMASRPTVISVETHGALYTNPYIREIEHWMSSNGYTLWYKDKSDSVYVRADSLAVTVLDKVRLMFDEALLCIRRIKKRARRAATG